MNRQLVGEAISYYVLYRSLCKEERSKHFWLSYTKPYINFRCLVPIQEN
jgi:hypothetical protein